jgi:hypothetical protein
MRSFAKPRMRSLATRLMLLETSGENDSRKRFPAGFTAIDRLRPSLATLMGSRGYQALLSRALALASAEIPWLRAVHVNADGALEGLKERDAQLHPDEFLEGRIVLLAQLLGLLAAFIGETLTLRLVGDVWPRRFDRDWIFEKGNQNENAS